MSIADRYARRANAFLACIEATGSQQWDAPSPCDGWSARDVVAHVINGHRGVHTWDLARASGGDEKLDPEDVARVHQALLPHEASLASTGAFGASLPCTSDADAQTGFLYFTGRRP